MNSKKCRTRRAMTLVELLVVMGIIGFLIASLIPAVQYGYRNRAVSEASRQLNSFIGAAQSRSQQTGRPIGIAIERSIEQSLVDIDINEPLPTAVNYSVNVFEVEVPPLYSGDIVDSRSWVNGIEIHFDETSSLISPRNTLIRPGDFFKIQFDNRGPFFDAYRQADFSYTSASYFLNYDPVKLGANIPSIARNAEGCSYRIQRKPVRSPKPPLELPRGAVIDLSVSGYGRTGTQFNPNQFRDIYGNLNPRVRNTIAHHPVNIMFDSDGSILNIYFNNSMLEPTGMVHLLVGSLDQVWPNAPFLDEDTETANVMDLSNKWVSINHLNGKVTTTPLDKTRINQTTPQQRIAASRNLVVTGSSLEAN